MSGTYDVSKLSIIELAPDNWTWVCPLCRLWPDGFFHRAEAEAFAVSHLRTDHGLTPTVE